ncbi:MAG: cardiolipin synthase [Thermodesulfobacteriota bacterium]
MLNSFSDILNYQIFFIIGEILVVFTLLHMLYQRRTPTSIISWLLLFVIIPYFSVILYFFIGVRKRPDKKSKSFLNLKSEHKSNYKVHPVDGILRANGIGGISHFNHFKLISDSVKAFDMLLQAIQSARKSICFSTYVFKNDPATKILINALTERAKNGVNIRILIDSLGSWPVYFNRSSFNKLQKAGGEICFFMPLLRLPYRNHINLRNHRKIYIFDNKQMFSGGMNLAEEYLGPEKSQNQWQDLLFECKGEAVYQYAQIFEADWAYAAGTRKIQTRPSQNTKPGSIDMQVVPSGPDIKGDALLEAILSAIYNVKKRIWIVTPYFLPDDSMIQALSIARHKGIEVKLITPKKSNHLLADLVRSSYMRELQENDIELVLYKGGMLHAKAILCDHEAAMIGSVNIDNRSLLLNYEVVSIVYSKQIIDDVEKWMQSIINNSDRHMADAAGLRRISENLLRVLAPQL